MQNSDHEKGSITLDAALILPIFLAIVITMMTLIQIAMAQLALTSAVTGFTETVNTHMYPADLLVNSMRQSPLGSQLTGMVDTILETRDRIIAGEEQAGQYSMYIPDPVMAIIHWEQASREHLEGQFHEANRQLMIGIFEPIFVEYVRMNDWNRQLPNSSQLHLVDIRLPNLTDHSQSFFGITAQYTLHVAIPFIDRSIVVEHHAVGRSWVGT